MGRKAPVRKLQNLRVEVTRLAARRAWHQPVEQQRTVDGLGEHHVRPGLAGAADERLAVARQDDNPRGSGIPEEQAKRYETGIREGNIVMGVSPRNEEDAAYFEREWRGYRGEDIYRPTRRAA